MDLSSIKPAERATKKRKRIARGEGSGYGGTATRGHKGAQSRSGYSRRFGFEGGQMPLHRRVPKFGFINRNRVAYKAINLDALQAIVDKTNTQTIDPELLRSLGIISKKDLVKILGRGEINAKLEVKAHAFSASAKNAIEAKEGTAIKID